MQKTEKNINEVIFEFVCYQPISEKHEIRLFYQQRAQEMPRYGQLTPLRFLEKNLGFLGLKNKP